MQSIPRSAAALAIVLLAQPPMLAVAQERTGEEPQEEPPDQRLKSLAEGEPPETRRRLTIGDTPLAYAASAGSGRLISSTRSKRCSSARFAASRGR